MIGRSMSFSMNWTMTSCPIRGRNWLPMPPPARRCATRTQHVASPPSCQWKRMRTRPRRSQYSSSAPAGASLPSAPTTIALCAPVAVGRGWLRPSLPSNCGRHTTSLATASKQFP